MSAQGAPPEPELRGRAAVSAVVLAGGGGRRMQGADKGLITLAGLAGQRLIDQIVQSLARQCHTVLISANRNLDSYRSTGLAVIPDTFPERCGPLAGVASVLAHVQTPLLLCVPCDSPFVSNDLCRRLQEALCSSRQAAAVAHDGEKLQPAFCLLRADAGTSLKAYLERGGRKLDVWYEQLGYLSVDFSDHAEMFININRPEDKRRAEDWLAAQAGQSRAGQSRSGKSSADGQAPGAAAISPDAALDRILQGIQPLSGHRTTPLHEALGGVLAQDIESGMDVPPGRNAAMDGYALSGNDLPRAGSGCSLRLVGASLAGQPWSGVVKAGECVRITTGALMPEGADTVVIQERAERSGGRVTLRGQTRPGDNVREAGEDIRRGATVLCRGRRIGPAELGLLASLGMDAAPVCNKPRVAFLSTGNELYSLGETLAPGGIHDSNRHTLYGMLTALGVQLIDRGVVRDEREALRNTLHSLAGQADAVITTGGVSVGEADLVRAVVEELGEIQLWRVAMKPGRPLAFGHIRETHFFGLPGNPVSVMVGFYLFVQPALQKMMGLAQHPPLHVEAKCLSALKKRPGRAEYPRGILLRDPRQGLTVRKTGQQGSGILRSMSEANCLIVLPMDNTGVQAGETVRVWPFADGAQGAACLALRG